MAIGCPEGRVGGYMYHTVPICLFCWLRSPADYRTAVESIISLGGDTDTTAAIVGALVGATAGVEAIPREWLDGLTEFPRSVHWMRNLTERLASPDDVQPARLFWPALLPRNIVFLLAVLAHGVRRIFPPW